MGKRGVKTCPKCGTGNGPRSFKCKNENCDHDFKPGQTPKTNNYKPKGIGRGHKQCPECDELTGPRSYTCPKCGHVYIEGGVTKTKSEVAPRKPSNSVEDWEALEEGETIKVVRGTGDYYTDQNGNKVYLTEPIDYKIMGKDDNGLSVHSKYGRSYVYMGQPMTSGVSDMIQKRPHQLQRV